MESRKMILMNLFAGKEWRHRYKMDLWLPRRRGCGGRMEWEFGVSSCKLKEVNPECSLEGLMLKLQY